MSASDKKKLRKEEKAVKLTERQLKEKAEAKKLKRNTVIFVTAMVLVVCIALGVLGVRAFNRYGVIERFTIAATVGGHEINSIELSYFYNDAIQAEYNQMYQNAYQQSSQYPELLITYMYGLDPAKSLAEQPYNPDDPSITWADHFVEQAINDAKDLYAIYDKAMSENYTLSAEQQAELDQTLASTEYYATMYGYSNAESYLRATYGNGASMKSYSKYMEKQMIAYAYTTDYAETLEDKFGETALREYDAKNPNKYDSFTYTQVYLQSSLFLGEGTKDENGTVTHTDEEKEAARVKAKEIADTLAKATSEEEFKKLVSELEINKEKEQVATKKYEKTLYDSVMSVYRDWVAGTDRAENDTTVLEGTSGSGDSKVINGYYVVMFHNRNDNKMFPANVRHLLVNFEGGTKDENNQTVYSDAEKAKAKEEADGYLKTWQDGEKTKESFIELVKAHSDDSSASTGGLFENITHDSSYVENFLNWSIDPNRKVGDAEVIETEYGYHVMYFESHNETTYRDAMIEADMQNEDYDAWYKSIVDPVTATPGNTSKLRRDIVLSGAN